MLYALTGNFGTGKSTVLDLFRRAGAIVVDSDQVVHLLYGREDVRRAVVSVLGDVCGQDGSIDRGKVARLIFSKPALREELEGLIHPLVFREIETTALRNRGRVVIAEIPLLFEAGYDLKVDGIILTVCSRETIFERLGRKGYTRVEIEERLSRQIPDEEKIGRADFVINTEGSFDAIKSLVSSIYTALKSRVKD